MALPNYVKFQRGSLTAYNRLSIKDENTLYFIYDANDDSQGTLYLGSRLIGSVGGSGGVNNLSELSDVIISSAQTGDFLVLNSEGKWTSTSASDVAQAILESGGNFISIDENEFQLNAVDGSLELKGFANAAAGMIPVKSNLGLTWQAAPIDLSSRVSDLETGLQSAESDISNLQTELSGVDGKIATAINSANHLKYEIISDLYDATASNVIYLYNSDPTNVTNKYSEYMLVNNQLELIGSMDADLSNYLTADSSVITTLNTKVSNLESNYSTLSNTVSGLSSTVSNLNTAVGNLDTTVSNLETTVSNLQNDLDDYVLTSTFESVVGDLTAVNGVLNNLNTDASIAEDLTDIYNRLTWKELNE